MASNATAFLSIAAAIATVLTLLVTIYFGFRGRRRANSPDSFVAPISSQSTDTKAARGKLTYDEVMALLLKTDRHLPPRLELFLEKCQKAGFHTDVQKTLMIKSAIAGIADVNFGTIETNGKLRTNYISWSADELGARNIADDYLDGIAALIVGADVKREGKPWSWTVRLHGDLAPVSKLLEKEDQWLALMVEARDRFLEAVKVKAS